MEHSAMVWDGNRPQWRRSRSRFCERRSGEIRFSPTRHHTAPFSPASQRRPRTRGEEMEATHSIEVEVAINFLLSFSAQKPHVKSKNI
jgi:hypothetical protein